MDVGADLPADPQPAEVVQQGEGLLHHPALCAQTGAVFGAAAGDQRANAEGTNLPAVLVVVVAAITWDDLGAPTRAAALAAHRRDGLQQRHQPGDVARGCRR